MALTARHVFASLLRDLVRERIKDATDRLAFGGGVQTLEAYREIVGEIRGLNDAIELCDEAERKADERERGR